MRSQYLKNALNRLFLNTEDLGFWDDKNGRIIEILKYDYHWNWKYIPKQSSRYGVFTLSILLLSKDL